MKFSNKDFFSKCDQIRRFLRIRSNLMKKSSMENFLFSVVEDIGLAKKEIENLKEENNKLKHDISEKKVKEIKMKRVNKQLHDSFANLRSFPGTILKHLKHYTKNEVFH